MCHLAELAVEMEDRLVDWEEDLATGNGDGVLGTEEHEDQQWLTGISKHQTIVSQQAVGTRNVGFLGGHINPVFTASG